MSAVITITENELAANFFIRLYIDVKFVVKRIQQSQYSRFT